MFAYIIAQIIVKKLYIAPMEVVYVEKDELENIVLQKLVYLNVVLMGDVFQMDLVNG